MDYLDTSVLVAALTNEARTGQIQAWFSREDPETVVISDWVITEFSAALSIKLRTGQIGPSHRADALAAFQHLCANTLTVLPVSGSNFRTASRFADQYGLGLRAGDALHLAIAADQGAKLCTLDSRLAEAGSALGVRSRLL